jgi:predicted Zn-dependent peptidase
LRPLVSPIRTLVDGVPTYYVDVDTPFVATLAFRVSTADERLARAGITHLAEHLAMPIDEVRGVDANASVQFPWTLFWAVGPPASAAEQLVAVSENLVEPPLERFETERRILETEAAGIGGPGPIGVGYTLRFGARAYGLAGHQQHGLKAVTAEEVAAWTATYFTRANAVLWLTGPPPDELRVVLRDGVRMPAPAPEPIPYLELPSLYEGYGGDDVILTMVARRSTQLVLVLEVAQRRLLRGLRYEGGLSYSVRFVYEPLTADEAHVVIVADSLEANVAGVRDRLVEMLRELAAAGATADEIARQAEYAERELRDPHASASRLVYSATKELLGGEQLTPAEFLQEYQEATPGSTARALAEALETALLLVPAGAGGRIDGFGPYPVESPRPLEGGKHRLRGLRLRRDPNEPVLIAGTEGVAIEAPGSRAAVRFDECELVLEHSKGTRALWSTDGFYVEIEPEFWRGGDEVVALVDRHAPPDAVVQADPERAGRIEAVSGAVKGRLRTSWLTNDELSLLPDVLQTGERLQLVTRGDRGRRIGVIAVTDRRLLFLYLNDVVVDVPLESVTRVSAEELGRFGGNEVIVWTRDDSVKFTGIKGATVGELASAIHPD